MIDSPSPLYGLCGVSDASESHSAMSLTPQSTYVHKTWSQSSFFVMTCKSFSRETQSIKIILGNISTLQYSTVELNKSRSEKVVIKF